MSNQRFNKWAVGSIATTSIFVLLIVLQSTLAQDDYGTQDEYEDLEMGQIPSYTLVEDWQLGSTTNVQFMGPNAIVFDSEDNIYTTEFMGNRVQKFNASGESMITTWGSEGVANGQFRNPTGIATDSAGNIYVAESGNHRIQKFTSDGEWLATWGEQGSGDGQFVSAMVVTVATVGDEERVYVSDWGNNRIQVFNTDGEFLLTWGDRGSESGQLMNPTGLTVDSNGNIWVVDRGNNRVQSFTPDGEHLSTWGSEGSNDGQFLAPTSIAIDADGFIYIAEAQGTRVQILTVEGNHLLTPMSTFNSPHGIAFDSTGTMYVADTMNGLVRKFERDVSTSNSTLETVVDTVIAPLPERSGTRPTTTGNVPHQQIGINAVPELNNTLHRWVSSLPNVEMPASIASLPGATGIWLNEGVFVAQPQVILRGREFSHIHPDGSLHAPLPFARAAEAVAMGWAERHPWADEREGWEGLVMLYTPQSEDDLEVVFQLIVESYNFVTGRAIVADNYKSS